MSDELPIGWAKTTLNECCEVIAGQSPPGETYNDIGDGLPFYQGKTDFTDINPVPRKWCSIPSKVGEPGDVLISVRAPVGPTNLANETCCIGRGLAALRPRPGIRTKFVLHGMRATQADLTSVATGSTFSAVSSQQLRQHRLLVAPSNEQDRIIDEIEKQFSRLDAATAALKRVQADLKRYRASVLKAACEGRLVPTEAELARKEGREYEPADKLLERILRERRARWEADTLAKMMASGKPPKDNGWKLKYKEPLALKTSGLPALPEGWCWAGVDQIVSQEKYSLAIGPFGSNLKVSDYRDEGTPLIFVRNIRARNFTDGSIQYVSEQKAKELRARSVSSGDILVTKMGDPPGDVCIYPDGMPDGVITADCIKIRLHPYLENPRYVAFSIESTSGRRQLLERTQGVAQLKVSLARFRDVAIPLPPLIEQQRIAETLERQLSFVDVIGERLRQDADRSRRFRQAILHSAFSGTLVLQNPADEPASVLLERIRAERVQSLNGAARGNGRRSNAVAAR
jgi:type I restriction enzyme, S subunit